MQDLKYVYGAKYSAGKCLITGQQSVQAEDAGLVPTQNKSASEKLVEEWLSMHTGQGELAHSVVWLCSTDLGYLTLCAGCCPYHSCVPGTERTARVSIQANATLRILLIFPLFSCCHCFEGNSIILTYTFIRHFYLKRLTVHSSYTFIISMCVSWELNPQPFTLLTQCSTTEPQEHESFLT